MSKTPKIWNRVCLLLRGPIWRLGDAQYKEFLCQRETWIPGWNSKVELWVSFADHAIERANQ